MSYVMTSDFELQTRIQRLYAALSSLTEQPASRTLVNQTDEGIPVFRLELPPGNCTHFEMMNFVQTAIGLLAHFPEHLKRAIRANRRDPSFIDPYIDGSVELRVLIDLANTEKHGPNKRDKGRSGFDPQLGRVKPMLQLTVSSVGSSASISSSSGLKAVGDGEAARTIDGDILDKDGAYKLRLRQTLDTATNVLGAMLKEADVKF